MCNLEQSLLFEEDIINGGADEVGLTDCQQSDKKSGENG